MKNAFDAMPRESGRIGVAVFPHLDGEAVEIEICRHRAQNEALAADCAALQEERARLETIRDELREEGQALREHLAAAHQLVTEQNKKIRGANRQLAADEKTIAALEEERFGPFLSADRSGDHWFLQMGQYPGTLGH